MSAALDRHGQFALMDRAIAGDTARNDFAALRHETAQHPLVFEIDEIDLILAEAADFASTLPISVFASFSHLYLSLQFFVFYVMTRFEAVIRRLHYSKRGFIMVASELAGNGMRSHRSLSSCTNRRTGFQQILLASVLMDQFDMIRPDLDERTSDPFTGIPHAALQLSFDLHRGTLVQPFVTAFSQHVPGGDTDIAYLFSHLSIQIAIPLGGGDAEIGNRRAGGRVPKFRITNQQAGDDHLVDICHVSCHTIFPGQ